MVSPELPGMVPRNFTPDICTETYDDIEPGRPAAVTAPLGIRGGIGRHA
jgi:hypothetical protein